MYVKVTDGKIEKYPYSLSELRAAYPNVSFPATPAPGTLEDFGVYGVYPKVRPEGDRVAEVSPELVDGRWEQRWIARPYTLDELENLREGQKRVVRQQARQSYVQPVTLEDGTQWNGGMNSALAIDGAVRLAQSAGLSEVTLYKLDNSAVTVTPAQGMAIAAAIAADYQSKFAAKQAAFAALAAIDLRAPDAKEQIGAVALVSG